MSVAQLKPKPPDLYITEELETRRETQADYLGEMRALQDLAGRMLNAPEEVLPRFVELAMNVTGAVSAGLSLYEQLPAPGVFRWRYLKGLLSSFEDALTPRDYSPCGVTMDEGGPVLSCHPERYYAWIADAAIVIPEVLLVPLHFKGAEPIGTLWIVADREGHFNAADARAAAELAHFAGIAVRMLESRRQLADALAHQETLTKEMAHRVNNLFTVAQSLVHLTARGTTTKEEMTEALVGRLSALARAHSLVHRSFASPREEHSHDLRALLRTIVDPHESRDPQASRFTLAGPPVTLGAQSLNGLALVFHELTTNAVKYGALASDGGTIDVAWTIEPDGMLEISWSEDGGREISETPELNGFGSKLLRDTIALQLGGTLDKTWNRNGLRARIVIPTANL